MKKDDKRIEEMIKQGLSPEESAYYDSLREQNLTGMISGLFRGPTAWLSALMSFLQVVLFGVFLYCVIRFINEDQLRPMLQWGGLGMLSIVAVGMLKLYLWMHMLNLDVRRALKRIELVMAGNALARKKAAKP
ncbi:DUF6768 family protein [Robiginitalea sp. SC105]|uniref:DUF6768 family protein n=1 Tax=Robiginitalea sp. SC105 TaxID=2762332 RepID=UPI0016399F5C|nr:DUF6768 family protein [Robiginitalea sp. SC105]MBC2840798.1 hypothetical protein [Robiginitalea sp. SC105]